MSCRIGKRSFVQVRLPNNFVRQNFAGRIGRRFTIGHASDICEAQAILGKIYIVNGAVQKLLDGFSNLNAKRKFAEELDHFNAVGVACRIWATIIGQDLIQVDLPHVFGISSRLSGKIKSIEDLKLYMEIYYRTLYVFLKPINGDVRLTTVQKAQITHQAGNAYLAETEENNSPVPKQSKPSVILSTQTEKQVKPPISPELNILDELNQVIKEAGMADFSGAIISLWGKFNNQEKKDLLELLKEAKGRNLFYSVELEDIFLGKMDTAYVFMRQLKNRLRS